MCQTVFWIIGKYLTYLYDTPRLLNGLTSLVSCKLSYSVVGQFNGLVTLPRIADVYEALGRFLRDLNLLNEVGICSGQKDFSQI